ncbi:14490_t:CDS:2, partial [Gigaspora margarita]
MLTLQEGKKLFSDFVKDTKNNQHYTCEDITLFQFLVFCRKKCVLYVKDRKTLYMVYTEQLETIIKENTVRSSWNKRFTKSELKSIKEDLPKDQKHKDLSLLFAQKLKIESMGIVSVKNYK